jgi:hypothetical protein
LSKTKPARMDTDIFAAKGEPSPPAGVHAPARTVPLPSAPAPAPAPPPPAQASGENTADDQGTTKKKRRANPNIVATTIAFPPAIMAAVQERLQQDQSHNLQTLVFLGLTKLGIEIDSQYLKPKRRRWTR